MLGWWRCSVTTQLLTALKFFRTPIIYYRSFFVHSWNLKSLISSMSRDVQLEKLYLTLLDYFCMVLLTIIFSLLPTLLIVVSRMRSQTLTSLITSDGSCLSRSIDMTEWESGSCLSICCSSIDEDILTTMASMSSSSANIWSLHVWQCVPGGLQVQLHEVAVLVVLRVQLQKFFKVTSEEQLLFTLLLADFRGRHIHYLNRHSSRQSVRHKAVINKSEIIALIIITMKSNQGKPSAKKSVGEYDIYMNCSLGKGGYGSVYKGYDRNTKEEVAVKMIDRINGNKLPAQEAQKITSLKREATILSKMNSEGVVGFRNIIATKRYYYIIQELCDNTLEDVISEMGNKYFTEKEAVDLMTQFLNGYYALISMNIIHRDLKPNNLLMKGKKLKIADFGLSRKIHNDSLMMSLTGTLGYQSPEVFRNQPYSSKCDVYSFGCIFYEVLYKKKALYASKDRIKERILELDNMEFPVSPKVSEEVKSLIQSCLKSQQKQRISWLEIYNHPIFMGRVPSLQKLDMTLKYILSTIRKEVQHRNLDVSRFLQKMGIHRGKQIGIEDYAKLLLHLVSIDKNITKEGIKFSFNHFDRDNSGKISFEEFEKTLNKHGVDINSTDEKFDFDIIKKVVDDDFIKEKGYEDFTQEEAERFASVEKAHKKLLNLIINKNKNIEDIESSFNIEDLSQQGLNIEAFTQFIQKSLQLELSKHECELVFEKFDDNNDKKIDLEEFKHHVCRELRIENYKSYTHDL